MVPRSLHDPPLHARSAHFVFAQMQGAALSGAREALEAATQQKVAALVGLSDAQAAQVSQKQTRNQSSANGIDSRGSERIEDTGGDLSIGPDRKDAALPQAAAALTLSTQPRSRHLYRTKQTILQQVSAAPCAGPGRLDAACSMAHAAHAAEPSFQSICNAAAKCTCSCKLHVTVSAINSLGKALQVLRRGMKDTARPSVGFPACSAQVSGCSICCRAGQRSAARRRAGGQTPWPPASSR